MPLSTKQIAVRKITSNKPRSEFDNNKIEQAARSIIAAEGVINPLVVRRTGMNSFELVDGDFEYHAAARAKEIDLAVGENIAAYIIEEEAENEKLLKEQLEIFRKPSLSAPEPSSIKHSSNLEIRLTNIESRTDRRFSDLEQQDKELAQKIADLEIALNERLPEKIPPLKIFNENQEAELAQKLSTSVGAKKASNFAQQIIEARITKPFKSLAEVVAKINGLGDKTMLKIIDRWLYSQ